MPKKLLVIGIAVAGIVVGALVYETLRGRPSSPSDLARDGEATRAAITEAGKSKGSSEVDLSVDEKGLGATPHCCLAIKGVSGSGRSPTRFQCIAIHGLAGGGPR